MLYDRDYMRDEDRPRWRSPIIVLIGVLGVVFLVECVLKVYGQRSLATHFAVGYQAVARGEVWRIFTFQFLHSAPWPFHFLFNAVGLWFFGRPILETQGRTRFWQIYLVSGLVGGLFEVTSQALNPAYPGGLTVGASGNVLGLAGAYCFLAPTREITFFLYVVPVQLRTMTLFWLLFGFSVFGTLFPSGGVAHAAHLGGLLAGVGFVKLFVEDSGQAWIRRFMPRRRPRPEPMSVAAGGGRPEPRAAGRTGAGSGTGTLPEESDSPDDFIRREVDPILDKISAHGIQSLTERERRVLERARERI